MSILFQLFTICVVAGCLLLCAYELTPEKTVIIHKEDVAKNFAFDGRVVLKDGQSYRIGAKHCADFWLGNVQIVEHKYRWVK